jgi:epsilon-lactone hydrolase
MVQVTGIQEQTISAAAAAFLRANNPLVIPGNHLTQAYADAVNAMLAAQTGPLLAQLRTDLGLRVRNRSVGGTRVVVITPRRIRKKRRDVAGFFAHGGGFALLSGNDYTAYRMAHDLGIVVYSVDYSLAPRAQFPVAHRETFAAYRAVSRRYRKVVVAGSSAGANLLITTTLRARRGGARRPRAAGLLAPAVDLRAIGDSFVANEGRDPLVNRALITALNAAYLGAASVTNPTLSPVLADFTGGFVPTIITTGTRDLLQSDAVRFYWTLRDAGVQVRLRVWEGMWHAFEGVPGLPEGEQNMREVFGFLERHI